MNFITPSPIDCVLAITYRCNSRCLMCNIWQIKNPATIDPAEYRKLPASLRDINISGGEPFLHPKITEVVKILRETCPHARIVISSNGFASGLIETKMKEILLIDKNIGIAFSLDGIGEMHNRVRQIPGGFEKVMDSLARVKKLGMTNIRLAFTILSENVSHFGKVYDLARENGVEFTEAFAQSSEHYFGGKQIVNQPNYAELKKQYEYVINQELKSGKIKSWLRAYFAFGLYQFVVEKKQILNNDPGTKFFFLDPSGDVYPSVVHNYPMGNIRTVQKWGELWQGAMAGGAREQVYSVGQPAWMICTARTAIRRHALRVLVWILRGKFFGVSL